ncbi:MAG: hypothetical protein O2834_07140 [Crenarchaeota archaeon]|nr:hypothetical protein [Thermoproteota archaeon]MDA1123983.1 hypothetical protein [Thermoproteota archaeon]MDC4217488.1 hypothetical protein [Candidatus Nitrosopumilus limneticus]HJJ22002.1 hypothetical protein [Nitrosopumilus sp.]
MDEDEKGKEFLKLIDDQNTVQWNIVAKLSSLIKSEWNSTELKTELETLIKQHYKITKDLNSLDDNNHIL